MKPASKSLRRFWVVILSAVILSAVFIAPDFYGQKSPQPDSSGSLKQKSKQTIMKSSVHGNWGGEHIALIIDQSGATIDFDCAHAVVDRALTTDARGNFSVTAIYTPESVGPTRQNNPNQSYRVKIWGHVRGGRMTLNIKRQSTNKSLGTFKLRQNEEPFLVKCR